MSNLWGPIDTLFVISKSSNQRALHASQWSFVIPSSLPWHQYPWFLSHRGFSMDVVKHFLGPNPKMILHTYKENVSSCFPNTIQIFSINKVVSFFDVKFYNNSIAFFFFSNPQQLYRPFQWSISIVDFLQKHLKFNSHLRQNCLHPLNNHLSHGFTGTTS